jgi:hypothetical protein
MAWSRGRLDVLNPKLIFTEGTRIIKATTSGTAMETMMMGSVRLLFFIEIYIIL